MIRSALAILLVITTCAVAHAQGDKEKGKAGQRRSMKVSFDFRRLSIDGHAAIGWYNDFGAGGRAELPIIDNLAAGVRNEIRASAGAEFRWFYDPRADGFGGYPILAAQWAFYVTDKWAFFPEFGFAGVFAPKRRRFWSAPIGPFGGFGGRHFFSENNALVFRMNWPGGIQVGITFL